MKILFISHSYPPLVGGIENQNRDLSRGLQKITETKIITNGKGKWWLPVFVPMTFFIALFQLRKYDACLFGSGILAPIGAALKPFYKNKKFFCVVHGLDIVYARKDGLLSKIYAKTNIPSLKKMDQLFTVGTTTIDEAIKVDIDQDLCTFIPNGVNPNELRESHNRDELAELFGKKLDNKKVILRLARFVPHKGTSWFIENIMPKLAENVVMIATGHRVHKNTAGDPDDFLNCEQAIIQNSLEDRVKLLPSLPQKDLKILLNTVDLVVSPNIKVPGSMEGFGINAIEAGTCERVVVASNLEGLADAIKDGENGFLVDPENVDHWLGKINKILDAGDAFTRAFGKRAGQYVEENFTWDQICQRYLDEMKKY